jgi:ubiquinone/menaquinone biosynthesis C-methylase UbiE
MAEEYDEITDLWYSWLFCRLHYYLVADLARSAVRSGATCLDVGCGTGFQSILLNICGNNVAGIDLAAGLLEKARRKDPESFLSKGLFDGPFSFISEYSSRILETAMQYRGTSPIGQSTYTVASATCVPFPNDTFDVVNCCGSTLSFVESYRIALSEMVRVLKPGGMLFLEVENKYCLDLLWTAIDAVMFRGRLGYDQHSEAALRNLWSGRREHVKIDYPFSTKTGDVTMPIWLFSSRTLLTEIASLGVRIKRTQGIHSVTNIVPSVLLDSPAPSEFTKSVFSLLSAVEEQVASWAVIRRLGCSLVLSGTKI